jgi:Flp pilus assembly pilin Flp
MLKLAKKFWQDEQGLELSEYAVMAALVIVVAVLVVTTLGETIKSVFVRLNSVIAPAASAG